VSCDYCGVITSFHGLSGQQQMPCVNCGKKLNLQAAVIVPPLIVNGNAKKATTKAHNGNQTSTNNPSKNVLFKDLGEIGSQGEMNQGIWSHFWVNHIIPMERDRKLT
jgi:hypothetical protein